ncbi:MAG: hypothetical protein ACKOD2_02575 [Ilumatobacteraceae bacterium]
MKTRPFLSRPWLALSLVVAVITPAGTAAVVDAASDSARLPRTDVPACSATQTTYCISEVVITDGGVTRTAKWVANGSPTLDATGAPNTKTFTTFGSTATNYTGRWSYDGFPVATRDFDGVYVKVAPANEFTDTMQVAVEPAGPSAAGVVGRVKDTVTSRVTSLPADMKVKVTVRLGELNPAVTMAVGNDVTVTRTLDGTVQVMTFEGNPVAVAQQASAADCDSTTSVAVAKPNQLFAIVAFKNGRDPYGVDGLSGDMFVTSNGVCKLTTPVWNQSTMSMDFTAAAPHFAPDGTTINVGFYRAVIPAGDADLLFGLKSLDSVATTTTVATPTSTTLAGSTTTVRSAGVPATGFISANKALTVEVRDTGGEQVTASRNVSFDGSRFVVTATGFTYSTKTLRMAMGTPPNAPRKITGLAAAVKGKVIRLTIPNGDTLTAYDTYLRSALSKKVIALKCTRKGKVVTCVSAKLTKGTWNVTVTPTKDGMAATASKKTVKVP